MFSFEHPDTGVNIVEYPVELGSTVGGRIVGELHVDYLVPTYQKNGFDTSDKSWRLTVEAVRGAGPILPKRRLGAGYDGDNESPLGKLINAFRRTDPGTKNLAIPNSLSKEFAKKFFAHDSEYESDEKWYKAAQESDRELGDGDSGLTPVNPGGTPSDDPLSYLSDENTHGSTQNSLNSKTAAPSASQSAVSQPKASSQNSSRDELILCSDKEEQLCGKFAYDSSPGLEATSWKLRNGQIRINGKRVPCHLFQDGIEIDFFFDPTHPILAEYPISPKQLLLQGLAEKFSYRDTGISLQHAFLGLVDNHLHDERINFQSLQERAESIIESIRDRMPTLIGHRFVEVKKHISLVEAEEEELVARILDEAPELVSSYQCEDLRAHQCLSFMAANSIKRVVDRFPIEFLDGKLFILPYSELVVGSEVMRDRLRRSSLDRVLSYLSDVIMLHQGGKPQSKQELIRHSNTIALLERLLAK